MAESDRKSEIERNLAFFLGELPSLQSAHAGKFALLRHQRIEGYYDTVADALRAGNAQFADKIFSIQQVTSSAADLGFYSHAMRVGAAQ